MKISDFLNPDKIFLYQSFPNKNEFYEKVIEELSKLNIIQLKYSMFIKRLFIKRENLQSTAIGNGIAAPHVYSDKFKNFEILISFIKDGMDFLAPDKQPVYLIFKIVSNERHVDKHLKILKQIAKITNIDHFSSLLKDIETKEDIINLIKKREDEI